MTQSKVSHNKTKKSRGGINDSVPKEPQYIPNSVEQGLEQGIEQGPEQGLEQGLEQGPEQGIEQGPEQGLEQGLEQGPEQGIEQGPEQGLEQGPEQGPVEDIINDSQILENNPENIDNFVPPQTSSEENIEKEEPPASTAIVSIENETEDFREKMADPANQMDYLFMNPNISTEPNKNKSYVRVGILHFTDSAGINVLRDTITSIGNWFGNKGIENIIYDKLRNTVLNKVGIILGENRRCYNTTIQIERIDETIFAHVYGTLYEKKQ